MVVDNQQFYGRKTLSDNSNTLAKFLFNKSDSRFALYPAPDICPLTPIPYYLSPDNMHPTTRIENSTWPLRINSNT
jgi:hypothetical protein